MLFLDDDSQHKYNSRANTTLQVILQIFENYMAEHGFQMLLIDAEENVAVVGAEGLTQMRRDVAVDLATKINNQFKKKSDSMYSTCILQSDTEIIFSFHIADSKELDQLH